MNYFIYNDTHSIDAINLYLESTPLLPVTGFSEVDDPLIVCSVGFENTLENIKLIRKLFSTTEGTLRFSFDDRIWTVNNVTTREVKRNKTYIQVDITFQVNRYCSFENNTIELSSTFENIEILNKGSFISYPSLTVVADGDIDIYLNSQVFSIKNVTNAVTIDCEIEECWLGTRDSIIELKNMDSYGEFLFFNEGSNTLSISSTGSISKVIIEPRWIN